MSLGTGNQPLKADALRKSLLSAQAKVAKESEKLEKQQRKKERQDNIAYEKLEKEKIGHSESLKSLQHIESQIADRIEAIGVTNVTEEGSKTSGEIGTKLEAITAHEKALEEFKQNQERIRSQKISQIPQIEGALSQSRQDAAEALALSNAKMASSKDAGISLAEQDKLLKEATKFLQLHEQHNASVLASTKRLEQTRASIAKLDKTQSKDLNAKETTTRAQTESLRKEIAALQQERVELISAQIQVQAQTKPLEDRITILEKQQKDQFPEIHAKRIADLEAARLHDAERAEIASLKPPPPAPPFPGPRTPYRRSAPAVANPIVDATTVEQRAEPVVNAAAAVEQREEPASAIPEPITAYMPSAAAIRHDSMPSIVGAEANEYLNFRTPKQTPENRVPPSLDQVAQTMRFLTDLSKHTNAGLDLKELNDKANKITELMSDNSPEEMQNKINTDKDCNKAYGEWCIAGHEAVAAYHTNQAAYFKSTGQEALAAIAEANAADARGHAQINRDILAQSQGRFQVQEVVREVSPVVPESRAVDKPVAVEAAKPVIKALVAAQEVRQPAGSSSTAKASSAKQAEVTPMTVGIQLDSKTAKRIVPAPQEQPKYPPHGIPIGNIANMIGRLSANVTSSHPVAIGKGEKGVGGVGGR